MAALALRDTEAPAAVVSLVDFLDTTPAAECADEVLGALTTLTGERFDTTAQWRSWLWLDGREYLRGTSRDPRRGK
jgi:hypothetical protein